MTDQERKDRDAAEKHAMRFDPECKFTSLKSCDNARSRDDFLAGIAHGRANPVAAEVAEEDWKYFPYGRGFSENDDAGVGHAK